MQKVRYVDFDGTLATYYKWEGAAVLGNPVTIMVERVKKWIARGDKVVIFTTRICTTDTWTKPEEAGEARKAIEEWCVRYIGVKLDITCEKGFFDVSYDDKVEHIDKNTGKTREEHLLELIGDMRKHKPVNDEGVLNFVVMMLNSIVLEQRG